MRKCGRIKKHLRIQWLYTVSRRLDTVFLLFSAEDTVPRYLVTVFQRFLFLHDFVTSRLAQNFPKKLSLLLICWGHDCKEQEEVLHILLVLRMHRKKVFFHFSVVFCVVPYTNWMETKSCKQKNIKIELLGGRVVSPTTSISIKAFGAAGSFRRPRPFQ